MNRTPSQHPDRFSGPRTGFRFGRPALFGAALLGIAGLVTAFAVTCNSAQDGHHARDPEVAHTAPATANPVPTALAYRTEHGTLYDVDWRVSTTVPVPGLPPQSTALELVGVVQATDLGLDGARRLVGVRLVSVRSANMTALEQPLYTDAAAAQAALVGQPVVLALSADGAVEDVYLEPSTSPLAKNVLNALALHFGVTLPRPAEAKTQFAVASNGYVATEPGDFGNVVWNYTRGTDRLLKVTDGEQGKGRGEVRFEAGLPIEIRSELLLGAPAAGSIENDPAAGGAVIYGSGSFRATRQANASDVGALWPRPDLSKLERHAPDARPTPMDETASNLAVANGFTLEDLQFMVAALGNGQAPRKGDLIRAAGFMQAHPESCDTLAAQFAASPPKAREFILDLLSSSGDTKAQAVMRAVLTTPAARQDPALFQYMLQRFAFVDNPNAESVAFVFAQWEGAKQAGDLVARQAAAYTLGSLAFHAQQSDNTKLAEEIVQSLLRDLKTTRNEDEEVGLIASIGNSGMPAALQPILARADSKNVRLRSQAALSLRKFDAAEVRAVLIGLVGDDDLQVAQAALRSLDTQTIGDVELTRLAERTESGRMNTSVDPALVTFVALHSQPRAPAERILRAVDARVGDRYKLKDQVDNALAALAASAPGKAAASTP